MGETGTTTFRGVALDDAIYEVGATIRAIAPSHAPTRETVRLVATHLYGDAWWIKDLIEGVCRELDIN